VLQRPVEPAQYTSWAFTDRARASGLVPSMGSIGDCYDAMIESFCGRVQVELLNRQRWRTRIDLANALFEYLEIFRNRRRRHSALGMLTPSRIRTPGRASRARSMTTTQQPDSGKPGAHHIPPGTPGRFN
jgi:transposase InsO family protein